MTDLRLDTREARENLVDRFFRGTGHSYDRVVRLTTFGFDARWKRRLLAHVPEDARSILDLACGTGILTAMLRDARPRARILGVDVTGEYLDLARERMRGVEGVSFLLSNAETMELTETFDCVVSSYIPKYVDPDVLLDRLKAHLSPRAVIALHDFDHPRGAVQRAIWSAHMWLLKTTCRRVFPEWGAVFDDDLARVIRQSRWANCYRRALVAHGFTDVAYDKLTFRTAGIVCGRWP